jgi:AMP-activated protein kinase-like protein
MSQVEGSEIEDVCWELFGGGCGPLQTKAEMAACTRKIRSCDTFVPAFRRAVALVRATDVAARKAPAKKAQEPPAPVAAAAGGEPQEAAPIDGGILFSFAGDAKKVEVAGSFSQWKPVAMSRAPGETRWSAVVKAPAGQHLYKLIVDGVWIRPPHAPSYVADGQGAENGVITT